MVPISNNHLGNTAGGSFTSTTQGGAIMNNNATGTVITKALYLKDNAADFGKSPLPIEAANGLVGNTTVDSSGDFAYYADGQYIILGVSTTIGGVSKNNMLIPGAHANGRRPIHKFEHSFGAKTLTKWRAGEYTLIGRMDNGNAIANRRIWLTTAGTASAAPAALNENMWDISDGDATDRAFDSAAEPTRAIPGELVMKVDFVTTSVASGGDFYDYKPITGM